MRFWCVRLLSDWSWEWRPYYGVWVLVAAFATVYGLSWRRHLRVTGRSLVAADRRHVYRFAGALAVLWITSDWPLGALGSGYLLSAHMMQFLLYVLGVAPLMLLGVPEWMARRFVHRLQIDRLYRIVARPLVAGVLFNVLLVCSHAPDTVDLLRGSQLGSFVIDMTWLLMGLIAWSPVISPLPEVVHESVLIKMAYLFLAIGGVSIVPAGFMVFSEYPLYSAYELAPRVGLSAVDDQQLAGAIMKVGMVPVVWGAMAVMWARWFYADHAGDQSYRRARADAPPRSEV
ncbi:MAG: cytochrome c oxidase assembly protein [Acidimicrobiia bacterium]|nr:cytochrome c oxidase assembly protein [Acidimicrobiia bacterium]MBA3984001.1 cytochrome c oxidase assembly protein [Acidimicrobiia bacterium]MDQ3390551.1 cytochrome c oxidase assembly protein [Actinomycetota bacterium]